MESLKFSIVLDWCYMGLGIYGIRTNTHTTFNILIGPLAFSILLKEDS